MLARTAARSARRECNRSFADRRADLAENFARVDNRVQLFSRCDDSISQYFLLLRPIACKLCSIALEGDPALHDRLPFDDRIQRRGDVYGERKAVKQLWPQQALFRVHRAKQDELCGMRCAKTFSFDHIHAARCGIEESVAEMRRQKIDFIDIQDSTMRFGEQAGFSTGSAFECAFEMQSTEKTVFPLRADRKVNKGSWLRQKHC